MHVAQIVKHLLAVLIVWSKYLTAVKGTTLKTQVLIDMLMVPGTPLCHEFLINPSMHGDTSTPGHVHEKTVSPVWSLTCTSRAV